MRLLKPAALAVVAVVAIPLAQAAPAPQALPQAAQAVPQGLPAPIGDSDYRTTRPAEVELGRLLFWDKILSGNENISCATCHHPRFGSSDGLSLGIGEGGKGLGPERVADPDDHPEQRIPRNSPGLWNLGAREFTVLFADGRVEADPNHAGGFRTPLEDEMVTGFDSALSAQTMFPVLSADEMAGHYQENPISTRIRLGRITGPDGVWAALAARVAGIERYRQLFAEAYPQVAAGRPIGFTDISNAVAAYMAFDFRSDGSPFDAFLRTGAPLPADAARGMALFYGQAGCGTCHSGKFQTDHGFHAMGEPQLGPGKAERFERHQRDTGRQRVTNRREDAFAFRTPSLRNVTLTAPYGHAGSHRSLPAFIRYHADPVAGIEAYSRDEAVLPQLKVAKPDWNTEERGSNQAAVMKAAAARAPVVLSDADVAALVAFLTALEDPVARAGGRLPIPDPVPSGLPIDR